jgi:uncharacterized integral membrane protein (TIGR00698 family)
MGLCMFRNFSRVAPGILFCGGISISSILIMKTSFLSGVHTGPLPVAILIGLLVGNILPANMSQHLDPGMEISRTSLLRFGIVLYGFQVTFQQIYGVGLVGIAINIFIILSTFALAVQLGTRVLGMDRDMAMLIGVGNSICGAAAILATEPVLRSKPQGVPIAVATVVIFGTIAMLIYPLLYSFSGLSDFQFGLFIGSTVHEVAQVLGAGWTIGENVADAAVIEKLIRVMMLGPFLLFLSYALHRKNDRQAKVSLHIPWFALFFVIASGINSLGIIPGEALAGIRQVNVFILAMAMASLGAKIKFSLIRSAGKAPLLLGAILFVHLSVCGFLVNKFIFEAL